MKTPLKTRSPYHNKALAGIIKLVTRTWAPFMEGQEEIVAECIGLFMRMWLMVNGESPVVKDILRISKKEGFPSQSVEIAAGGCGCGLTINP